MVVVAAPGSEGGRGRRGFRGAAGRGRGDRRRHDGALRGCAGQVRESGADCPTVHACGGARACCAGFICGFERVMEKDGTGAQLPVVEGVGSRV